MRLLVDTHVAIWALAGSPRLTKAARDHIADGANEIYVSAVCIWEIAIKRARGRMDAPPVSGRDALALLRSAGYRLLDVTPEHACAVEALPAIHSDPFDRLIVAQALVEPLRLLTHDRDVAAYSDTFILF